MILTQWFGGDISSAVWFIENFSDIFMITTILGVSLVIMWKIFVRYF